MESRDKLIKHVQDPFIFKLQKHKYNHSLIEVKNIWLLKALD